MDKKKGKTLKKLIKVPIEVAATLLNKARVTVAVTKKDIDTVEESDRLIEEYFGRR